MPKNVCILRKRFDPLNMLVRSDDLLLVSIIYICKCVYIYSSTYF